MRMKKFFFMFCMFIVMTLAVPLIEIGFCDISNVEAAQKIKISKKKASLYVGQTLTLKMKGTNQKVIKWFSSKNSIASVSSKGKVKARKNGTATITAKVGKKRYKCKITVKSGLLVDKMQISLDDTSSTKVKVTAKQKGEIWYNIADASIVSCQWSSQFDSNNSTFLTISGKRKGTTVVTVSNEDTNEQIKIYVVVAHKPIAVSRVTLSKTSLSLYKDDTYTLKAAITPVNADNQRIIWKSSNTNVATVNNGVVNAVGAGNARITATVGNISAACNVIVKNAVNIKVITEFPKEFCYISSYNNYIYSKVNITNIKTNIKKGTDKYIVRIIWSGEKTYDSNGIHGTHWTCAGYKLYDSKGNVKLSGEIWVSDLSIGDKFNDKEFYIGDVPVGDYTLEITDNYR